MCGIAGVIAPSGFDPELLERMAVAIRHRGPDDEGYALFDGRSVIAFGGSDTAAESFGRTDISWLPKSRVASCFGNRYAAGFAHRRLSIVDLSPCGHQPMSYRGRYWITYNGEVYNYVELRRELEGLGHCFRTRSDTEVVLAAYAQWGTACLDRFNGMWALAILDIEAGTVFLARDRFGVKPLYMARAEGSLYFASEIKPLLGVVRTRRPNLERITSYLVSGISDSSTATFFDDVTKLDAGSFATIDVASANLVISRYYDLSEAVAKRGVVTDSALDARVAEFDTIFSDAVRLRLRSDVPVGTCLSGGLDSSAIASVAGPAYAKQAGRAFSAVTGISTQPDNDESGYARSVAERLGLAWHTTCPTYEDFASSVEAVMRVQEEPFGGASIVMQHNVMKRAREAGLPVMLDGQGGDEVLLGYAWHYGPWLGELIKRGRIRAVLGGYSAMRRNNAQFGGMLSTLKFLFGNANAALRNRYQLRANRYLASDLPVPKEVQMLAAGWSDVRKLQVMDIERTNLPALLRFEDRNSMAFAVETRLPFMDFRLVEFGLALSPADKIRDGWSKWLLRRWAGNRLPDDIVWRRKKLGFPAPDREWEAAHRKVMTSEIKASHLVCELGSSGRQSVDEWLTTAYGAPLWRLYSVALWDRLLLAKGERIG